MPTKAAFFLKSQKLRCVPNIMCNIKRLRTITFMEPHCKITEHSPWVPQQQISSYEVICSSEAFLKHYFCLLKDACEQIVFMISHVEKIIDEKRNEFHFFWARKCCLHEPFSHHTHISITISPRLTAQTRLIHCTWMALLSGSVVPQWNVLCYTMNYVSAQTRI